jgi:hypothetical protein
MLLHTAEERRMRYAFTGDVIYLTQVCPTRNVRIIKNIKYNTDMNDFGSFIDKIIKQEIKDVEKKKIKGTSNSASGKSTWADSFVRNNPD